MVSSNRKKKRKRKADYKEIVLCLTQYILLFLFVFIPSNSIKKDGIVLCIQKFNVTKKIKLLEAYCDETFLFYVIHKENNAVLRYFLFYTFPFTAL